VGAVDRHDANDRLALCGVISCGGLQVTAECTGTLRVKRHRHLVFHNDCFEEGFAFRKDDAIGSVVESCVETGQSMGTRVTLEASR
jgi:hypothetical protein